MPATTPTRPPPTQAAARGARSLAGQSLPQSALLVPLDLPDQQVRPEQQVLPAPQGQLVPQEQPVQQEQLGLLDQPEQPALRELLAQPEQADRQGPPVPRV